VVDPECYAGGVVGEDEDIASLNASLAELRQTGIHQLPAGTLLPVLPGHGQMVQVTPPAVMTTQYRADEAALFLGYETKTRIAPQICSDRVTGVGFVQPDAFGAPPQSDDRTVIFNPESANDGFTVATALGNPLFHSTVTLLARLRGLSTSQPRATAM